MTDRDRPNRENAGDGGGDDTERSGPSGSSDRRTAVEANLFDSDRTDSSDSGGTEASEDDCDYTTSEDDASVQDELLAGDTQRNTSSEINDPRNDLVVLSCCISLPPCPLHSYLPNQALFFRSTGRNVRQRIYLVLGGTSNHLALPCVPLDIYSLLARCYL